MSRDFDQKKDDSTLAQVFYQSKFASEAYANVGTKPLKAFHFYERLHYGLIDDDNNSITPIKTELVYSGEGRVFNIVADHIKLMQTNLKAATSRGVFTQAGEIFGNLSIVKAYKDPELEYGEYLGSILRYYNETHIPISIGKYSIASYEDYVKHFFKFIFNSKSEIPITMTRWSTSYNASILNTGLAFTYSNIGFNENQRKIDEIIDNPHYQYFSNLCLNFGFSISKRNPQLLVYDIASPAGRVLRERYGIFRLSQFFDRYYIPTFTLDNNLLYKNINIYYNKYVSQNSLLKETEIKCMRPVSTIKFLEPVDFGKRFFSDTEEVIMYARIRNFEEGQPFSPLKMKDIEKRIKNFVKKLDKQTAMSYINNTFRDQVWNKDHGYHDGLMKLQGKTVTDARRMEVGRRPSGGGNRSY